MKLKATDKTKKLFQLIGAGLISIEDVKKLVDTAKDIRPHNHLGWTLEQFSTLSELNSDIQIVEYILGIDGKKKNIFKLSVKSYFEILKFARDAINDICTAIQNIPQPELSAEMKAAGFDKLDFGDLGMARLVGDFEHVGTIAAYDLPMHIVIRSLDHSAAIKRCEQNHSRIMEEKSKLK